MWQFASDRPVYTWKNYLKLCAFASGSVAISGFHYVWLAIALPSGNMRYMANTLYYIGVSAVLMATLMTLIAYPLFAAIVPRSRKNADGFYEVGFGDGKLQFSPIVHAMAHGDDAKINRLLAAMAAQPPTSPSAAGPPPPTLPAGCAALGYKTGVGRTQHKSG
jgi:hypothetical protein